MGSSLVAIVFLSPSPPLARGITAAPSPADRPAIIRGNQNPPTLTLPNPAASPPDMYPKSTRTGADAEKLALELRPWPSAHSISLTPSPIPAAGAGVASHKNVRSRRARIALRRARLRVSPRSQLSTPNVPPSPFVCGPSEGRRSPRSQQSAPPVPP